VGAFGFMGASNSIDKYVYGGVISQRDSTDTLYEGVCTRTQASILLRGPHPGGGAERKLLTMSKMDGG